MELVLSHKVEILGFLFALSELLSLIPSVKSNGVIQMLFGLVKKAAGK
jgi:hypothetical protein